MSVPDTADGAGPETLASDTLRPDRLAPETPDTLGAVGELAALARILPRLPAAQAQLLGPGDDGAVVASPDGRFVVTTDMMIEGPDFRLAWSTPHDLGWKAAATNLSDVAAMGASATSLVVAIAAPAESPVSLLEGIADGLRDACATLAPGCGVVGGDLSVSTTLTIAVTAFGDLGGRRPVTRSGARAGDVVAVSGALGVAALGLRLLFQHGVSDAGEPDAASAAVVKAKHPLPIAAQLAPEPPIGDGVLAAEAGATAMLDLSDGLAIDARRLAKASGVGIDFDSAALGADLGTDLELGRDLELGTDLEPGTGLELALGGGEDHSLLATFPAGATPPGGFRVIGRVVDGTGILLDGVPWTEPSGWDPYRWTREDQSIGRAVATAVHTVVSP